MYGIKIVSSIAALVAFAEAQQQFVMAATTEATCTAEFGTWASGKCTAETSAATTVRKTACSTEHGTWNTATKVCTAETDAAKAKRECVAPSTWVAATGSGASLVAAKCQTAEETCELGFGTWAAGEGSAAGVCTAETAAAKTLREFECKQAYGSWASGKCTDETADAKAQRECVAPSTWAAGASGAAGTCTAETDAAKAIRVEQENEDACEDDAYGLWVAGVSGAAGTCTPETATAKATRVEQENKVACPLEYGTWVPATGSGTTRVAGSCTAETDAAKAERECVAAYGTWAAGVSGAAGVCTAETATAKTTRVNAAKAWCEVTAGQPSGFTYKAATEECFTTNWHQEAMCAVTSDIQTDLYVAGEPYFVADAGSLDWCLDYTTEFSKACATGCSDWGDNCVPEEYAHICEDNEFNATYGSNAGLIVGVLFGVLGAVAVGIVVYCFCCKKNDDDYQKA